MQFIVTKAASESANEMATDFSLVGTIFQASLARAGYTMKDFRDDDDNSCMSINFMCTITPLVDAHKSRLTCPHWTIIYNIWLCY